MKTILVLILSLVALAFLMFGGEETGELPEKSVESAEEIYEADPEVNLEYLHDVQEEANFNENRMSEPSTLYLTEDLTIDINDGIIALVNVGEDGHLFDVPDGTSTPVIGFDLGVVNTEGGTEEILIGESILETSTGERLEAVELYDTTIADTTEGGSVEYGGVTFLLRESMPTHVEWADWTVEYEGETHTHRIYFDGYSAD